ncbi:Tigger transposable element-derived protein 6 [Dictyocoela muelleri]|nr:Tigger transposable element-derived protein 6 [Dictyocoela muelleri]
MPRKTKVFDRELFKWYQIKRQNNFLLSNGDLQTMAMKMAQKFNVENFKASLGYVQKFKSRYNLVTKQFSGEENLIYLSNIQKYSNKVREILKNYKPEDIYNCDESVLLRRNTRKRSISGINEKNSGKIYKERITILFCTSLAGEN